MWKRTYGEGTVTTVEDAGIDEEGLGAEGEGVGVRVGVGVGVGVGRRLLVDGLGGITVVVTCLVVVTVVVPTRVTVEVAVPDFKMLLQKSRASEV